MKKELLFGRKTERYCGIFFVHFNNFVKYLSIQGKLLFCLQKGQNRHVKANYYDRYSRAIRDPSSILTFSRKNPPKMNRSRIEIIP